MNQIEIMRTRCEKLGLEIKKIEEKESKLQQKKKEILEKRKAYEAEIDKIKEEIEIEHNKKIAGIIRETFGEITEERLCDFRNAMKEVSDLQLLEIGGGVDADSNFDERKIETAENS